MFYGKCPFKYNTFKFSLFVLIHWYDMKLEENEI